MRAEHQLLIHVARRSAKHASELHQLLDAKLDWEYLLRVADRHCLIPLLYVRLNEATSSSVPPQIMSRLRNANHRNTRSNLFLTGELIRVLDVFAANGISAIPFKGPTLALQAYGDVGFRQFGDLDVLVQRQDLLRVRDLLVSRGFKPNPELTGAQQAALLRFDCAYNFDIGQGVMLDVHWNFVEQHLSIEMDTNRLWTRLEPITLGGQRLMTLSPEDLLLILCLHGFTHRWERLGWICDIASLIEGRKNLAWQSILQDADRLGLRRILLLGLSLAYDLLDATIPVELQRAAAGDAVVKTLAHQVQQNLFAEQRAATGLIGGVLLNLKMRERKRDRIVSCLRLILTPRSYDWMSLSLPESLFFLYYPLRPLRLAGKYGVRILKVLADGLKTGAAPVN